MVMNTKILFLILTLGLLSCKKAHERSCFKGKGEESSLEVAFDNNIDSLILYDDIFYTLVQGKESKVTLSGGENLLEHIEIVSDNGTLTIRNKNKCNFLRSFKNKIHALIYVDSIGSIHYEGTSELRSQDTLFSNELRLSITDGAGDVELTLKNAYTSAIITHGFGNFTLHGETSSAFLNCSTNSYCDTRSFKVNQSLIVNSNTVANMLINVNSSYLEAVIHQNGDVKYIGTPLSKVVKRLGKGRLVDLNN
jgi:hypothetical protein